MPPIGPEAPHPIPAGIKVNKKAKFIEVKQGPYDEQNDKRRF